MGTKTKEFIPTLNPKLYVFLTGIPTLYYAVVGIWWAVDQLLEPTYSFVENYPLVFQAGFATGLAMLIFYGIHLFGNRRIDRTARFLWLFRFIIASPVSLLMYWAGFIARIGRKR